MAANENRLIWLDMEMTGLDPEKERIIEVAVVVLDENNKVLHSELVPEIAQEPNYDAALTALK